MHHLTAAGRRIAAFYWVGLDWQGTLERACLHLALACSTNLLLSSRNPGHCRRAVVQLCSCAVLFGASSPLIAHAGHIALDVTVQSSHRFYLFRLIHAHSTRISHLLNSPLRECHGIVALSCWVDLLVAGC